MALATSGAKGAEKLAIKWARQKGVTLVLAKADFDRHGRAAPFRANDEMLSLDPVCVLTLVNSLNADRAKSLNVFGPAANLAQKAAERGLRHHPITGPDLTPVRRPQGRRPFLPWRREGLRGGLGHRDWPGLGWGPGGLDAIAQGEPGAGPSGLKATSPAARRRRRTLRPSFCCAPCRPVSSAADRELGPLPAPDGRMIAG